VADIYSRELPVSDYEAALRFETKPLRVGVPQDFFFESLDPETEKSFTAALHAIGDFVGDMREVTVPMETGRAVASGETYAYHSLNVERNPQMYNPSTLARILAGQKVTAAQYIEGRQSLEKLRRSVIELFSHVDLLVSPTTPVPAPTIAELEAEPDKLREREVLLLRNTRPFNVLGVPAISIPCGTTRNGLPIGLQIAAAPGREDYVVAISHALEKILSGA
jgi:aspartyl-tRNA(Asn)/glutamyl-tRNA(Gln) amidotransferase subunit A